MIDEWGGGPAKMNDKVGFAFSLWGGDIFGKNIDVVPGKKLVQEWYGGKWEKPSIARFELSSENDGTRIDFFQTEVPDNEFKGIQEGWKDYYLGPIKDFVEKP